MKAAYREVLILREGIPSLQKQVLSLKALGDGKNAAEWSKQPRRVKARALDNAKDALKTVLFAINDTYDSAQRKHLEETLLPELKYVPGRLIERWSSINTKEEWYNSVSVFAGLADDVLDLARSPLGEKVGQ